MSTRKCKLCPNEFTILNRNICRDVCYECIHKHTLMTRLKSEKRVVNDWIDYDVQQPKEGEIVVFWEKYSSEPFMGRLLKHGIYVYTGDVSVIGDSCLSNYFNRMLESPWSNKTSMYVTLLWKPVDCPFDIEWNVK